MEEKLPWQKSPLNEWRILDIQMYIKDGKKCIYVSMKKGSRWIRLHGLDDWVFWNNLELLTHCESFTYDRIN